MRRTVWITPLVLAVFAASASAQTNEESALAARMNALKGNDWQPAFELGNELAALPDHKGFQILRDNWTKGAGVEARKQMFKGWVFSKHPDTLKVLDLGARDPDIGLQNWSFSYLKGIAYTNFAEDYGAYKTWFAKYGDRPLPEVQKENAQFFLNRVLAATGNERKVLFRFAFRIDFETLPDSRDSADKIVRSIFADPQADQDAAGLAAKLIKSQKPDEAFLREVVVPALDAKSSSMQYQAAQILGDVNQDWTLDLLLAKIQEKSKGSLTGGLSLTPFAQAIAQHRQPRAIPPLIAIIESQNGYDTVYGVGYFGLTPLTGVDYDESHDGAWWHEWWAKNRTRFPEAVRSMEIPAVPKVASFTPTPKAKEIARGDVKKEIELALTTGESFMSIGERAAKEKNYKAVPLMISAIAAEDTTNTIYGLGYFGLASLTGVDYDESHDGKWWTTWWSKNRDRFTAQIGRPSLPKLAYKKPQVDPLVPNAPDVASIPSENLYAKGDKDMRYLLAGPAKKGDIPKEGYKLLVILPGGDGSADFHPFLKRVLREALPPDFLIAELVAKQWSEKQFENVVWPNKMVPWAQARFTTEEFIESVIADVKKRRKIDGKNVLTMGWSSSGPPVYAHLGSEKRSTTGAFVAMSIFQPKFLPNAGPVKDIPVTIIHSPQDFIPIAQAELARDTLKGAGADVQYSTYEGGHGWHGDIFATIREAVAHLIKK